MAEEKNILERFQESMSQQWYRKLEASRLARADFDAVSEQCWSFYAKDCGFMWKDKFRNRFLKGIDIPMFEVTINKASELVSIYGPYLFWDYPNRYVRPYDPVEFDPSIFVDPEADEADRAGMQMLAQQTARDQEITKLRAQLMERYLNYTQREQRPKLAKEAAHSITEALITGRGVLWIETFKFPASERTLTGCFHGKTADFFIDPDCNDPELKSASWIARRHVSSTYDLERRFKLKDGSLKEYAHAESNDSKASHISSEDKVKRENGQTHDRIVWYEIWSKAGVGTRQHDYTGSLHKEFERVVGDYAYLCISPNCPFFLNAPPEQIEDETEDDVLLRMSWPIPTYIDNRWPCQLLEFKQDPNGCYPIALLAEAMGELIALNILTSAALENAYENRKQVVGYLQSMQKDLEKKIKSQRGTVYVPIESTAVKSIGDAIQYINKPGMNRDIWDAIEYMSHLFDKRTGLVEFMYAQSSTQDRSARATAAKEEKAGIRPDRMARDVAAWMTECAEVEKIAAAFYITGSDVKGLLGPAGDFLWDQFIAGADPEVVSREMTTTVEASDTRRPNREREMANLQQMMQFLVPVFQQLAAVRGDEEGIGPLNAYVRSLGKALEMDTTEWEMPPFSPPVDPMAQQMQQQGVQVEMAKTEAEAKAKEADALKKTVEAMAAAGEQDMDAAKRQQEFEWNQAEFANKLSQDRTKFQQKMAQDVAMFQMKGAQMRASKALQNQGKA